VLCRSIHFSRDTKRSTLSGSLTSQTLKRDGKLTESSRNSKSRRKGSQNLWRKLRSLKLPKAKSPKKRKRSHLRQNLKHKRLQTNLLRNKRLL
jgi:hypothetical protein